MGSCNEQHPDFRVFGAAYTVQNGVPGDSGLFREIPPSFRHIPPICSWFFLGTSGFYDGLPRIPHGFKVALICKVLYFRVLDGFKIDFRILCFKACHTQFSNATANSMHIFAPYVAPAASCDPSAGFIQKAPNSPAIPPE